MLDAVRSYSESHDWWSEQICALCQLWKLCDLHKRPLESYAGIETWFVDDSHPLSSTLPIPDRYNLYVYTDIIQYQAVWDSYSPLLGLEEVEGNFGENVNIKYNRVLLPLARNYIKQIRIEIKSDRDSSVDFSYRKVIVKLNFNPTQTPL